MGGLISLLRDIKTVYKDLKVTLKHTARIVLKVHGIVEDVEQTVQELKATVKGLSSKIHPHEGKGEEALEALVENVESKTISLKASLINASSQVFNEDLLRNTQEKWDKVVQYSRQSTEALANIVASTSFNIHGNQGSVAERLNCVKESISLSEVMQNGLQNGQEGNFNNDQALVPVFKEELPCSKDEGEIRDFEILPLNIMDSFWKCDIGCVNIDCVDFHQLATCYQAGEIPGSHSRKKKGRKRGKSRSKSAKKPASGSSSSSKTPSGEHNQTPARYHPHKNRKQPRETVALELIFLVAVLMEGLAMSNSDMSVRQNVWKEPNRSSFCRAAEIIELDD